MQAAWTRSPLRPNPAFRARSQPSDILTVLPEQDNGQHRENERCIRSPEPEQDQWARSTCDKRRERRVAKQRGTAEPDSGEGEAGGPRYTEQRAEEGRDTFSAFETEPDREDMSQECADRTGQRRLLAH